MQIVSGPPETEPERDPVPGAGAGAGAGRLAEAAGAGVPPVYVQVDAGPAASVYSDVETRGTPANLVTRLARDVYDDGIALACRCAEIAAARFQALPDGTRPDQVEMQVGIKLDASLGAYVVQSKAEAQLQLTFRWQSGTAS